MNIEVEKLTRDSKVYWGWRSSDSSGDSDNTLALKAALLRKRQGPRRLVLPAYDSRGKQIHWRPNKPPPSPPAWKKQLARFKAGVPTLMCVRADARNAPVEPDVLFLDWLYFGLDPYYLFDEDVVECTFRVEAFEHVDRSSIFLGPTTWTLKLSVYVPTCSGFLVYCARGRSSSVLQAPAWSYSGADSASLGSKLGSSCSSSSALAITCTYTRSSIVTLGWLPWRENPGERRRRFGGRRTIVRYRQRLSFEVDIRSIGVPLYALVVGRPPF